MNIKTSKHFSGVGLAAVTVASALFLSGCGNGAGTPNSSEPEPAASSSQQESSMDQEKLLDLSERLTESLGTSLGQTWISDGKLHVSTTDESKVSEIEAAGAVAHVVDYSAADLNEAITKVMEWQGTLDGPLKTAIHGYYMNPEDGGLTLMVDVGQFESIEKLFNEQKPIGDIPVTLKKSAGPASPAMMTKP
ncbi:hypothetical protein ACX8Z7_15920 [Glutamicibacter endophyticus]